MKKEVKANKLLSSVDNNISYEIGEHINFNPYGEGVIIAIKDKIITVAFPYPYGRKTLIKGDVKSD